MIATVLNSNYPLLGPFQGLRGAIWRDAPPESVFSGRTKERGTVSLSPFTETVFEFRRFVYRYEKMFPRQAQRRHFEAYLRGLIGPLERKSIEPIAVDQGIDWRRLHAFIACSPWDSETLLEAHRRYVRQTMGSERGILILDPTQFPKRGDLSVGVARQWCGQLGKEENCQNEINLCYATEQGHTYLDRRLYLPAEWAQDARRRRAARVPEDVAFRTSWQLAYEMIGGARREQIPHAWITGDEEFGKVPKFHDWLSEDGERYVFEVPRSARVWASLPGGRKRGPKALSTYLRILRPGRPRLIRVDDLGQKLPERAWVEYEVRDASKGPLRVRSAMLRVRFHRKKKSDYPEGWLLISETMDQRRQLKYFQSNGEGDVTHLELLRAGFARWPIEQCHGQGKNETGLGDYETRSWMGWHHHTALVFLAHHWLVLERNRLEKKIPRDDGRGSSPSVLLRVANRSKRSTETQARDAASAKAQPLSQDLALEQITRTSGDARAAQAHCSRSGEVGHHSNATVKTGQ